MGGDRVLGTGVDLVENERMRETLERWGARFRDRVFLPAETAYCEGKAHPWQYYAGRFAVKEAVSKALGTGIGRHLVWSDIEVVKDRDSGAPSVKLSSRAADWARSLGVTGIHVSLSHTRGFAVAHALLVGSNRRSRRNPLGRPGGRKAGDRR